jgi:hypothetical protein
VIESGSGLECLLEAALWAGDYRLVEVAPTSADLVPERPLPTSKVDRRGTRSSTFAVGGGLECLLEAALWAGDYRLVEVSSHSARKATQGQNDSFFGQLPYKCHLE